MTGGGLARVQGERGNFQNYDASKDRHDDLYLVHVYISIVETGEAESLRHSNKGISQKNESTSQRCRTWGVSEMPRSEIAGLSRHARRPSNMALNG